MLFLGMLRANSCQVWVFPRQICVSFWIPTHPDSVWMCQIDWVCLRKMCRAIQKCLKSLGVHLKQMVVKTWPMLVNKIILGISKLKALQRLLICICQNPSPLPSWLHWMDSCSSAKFARFSGVYSAVNWPSWKQIAELDGPGIQSTRKFLKRSLCINVL